MLFLILEGLKGAKGILGMDVMGALGVLIDTGECTTYPRPPPSGGTTKSTQPEPKSQEEMPQKQQCLSRPGPQPPTVLPPRHVNYVITEVPTSLLSPPPLPSYATVVKRMPECLTEPVIQWQILIKKEKKKRIRIHRETNIMGGGMLCLPCTGRQHST